MGHRLLLDGIQAGKQRREGRLIDATDAGVTGGMLTTSQSTPEAAARRRRRAPYSTVTLFARFRGWSTSHPRRTATW